jgi:CubicO group peptidase (beta-lactamase class C family)
MDRRRRPGRRASVPGTRPGCGADSRLTETTIRARLAGGALVTAAVVIGTACTGPAPQTDGHARPGVGALIDQVIAQDPTGTYRNVRAVLVTVDGKPLVERYYHSDPTATWDIEAEGRTIVASLIGIALAENKLHSLDDALGTLLPQYRRWMAKDQAAITLRQILTMTAGLPDNDAFDQEVLVRHPHADWIRAALELQPYQRPGKGFHESSAGSHLLSAILIRATGLSVLDYARQKLFDPMGIDTRPAAEPSMSDPDFEQTYTAARFAWPTDPQGREIGNGGLKLAAPDLAKLGALWLNQGLWAGRQLAPRDFMIQAQSHLVSTFQDPAQGYGYQQWTSTTADGHPAFAAVGRAGQLTEVVPADRAVVVVLSQTQPWEPTESGVADIDTLMSLVGGVIAPALS